jgi:hypothetical protein
MGETDEFSGYDEQGQPLYRATGDGPQCTRCGEMNGEHETGCWNARAILVGDTYETPADAAQYAADEAAAIESLG